MALLCIPVNYIRACFLYFSFLITGYGVYYTGARAFKGHAVLLEQGGVLSGAGQCITDG